MFLFPGLFFVCASAVAEEGSGGVEKVVAEVDPRVMAEYHRLSDEVGRLAERGIWPGVRKNFEELEALGIALGFDDLLIGAQLSRMDGNVVRTRH